jgi:hypothetical protein
VPEGATERNEREPGVHEKTERQRDRERERERDRERQRERGRQRETERETARERERDRQRDRDRETQRDTERETFSSYSPAGGWYAFCIKWTRVKATEKAYAASCAPDSSP